MSSAVAPRAKGERGAQTQLFPLRHAMHALHWIAPVFAMMLAAASAHAGLYFSGENFADLPSQWRGFLVDQRALRTLAVARADGTPTPLRKEYTDAAARLEKT